MASQADQQYQHPLPSPPQQAQPPLHSRNHSFAGSQTDDASHAKHRSFSFHSDKSRRHSATKQHIHETHEEKEARRLHTKADPTLAISEAEPSAIAAMRTQSSHVPLRSISHRDSWGHPIADPDLSNPTRNRWERPLDTIRGFEAAIDGGYKRKSMARTETDPVANWNRRSSYHPGGPQARFPQDSYYGSRPASQFGMATPGTARNSYFGGQGFNNGYDGGYGQTAPRQRASRMQTDSHYSAQGREQNVYPLPNKDRSYETVTSAAVSGNSDPVGYQTDPTSSDNSSIERRSPAKRAEPPNDYGIGFSQPQTYQGGNFALGNGNSANHPLPAPPTGVAQQAGRPPQHTIPRKQPSLLKRQPVPSVQTATPAPEKRKSWFGRRFSKNS